MAHFSPIGQGYGGQVTIWYRKHNRQHSSVCDKPYHMNKKNVQKWENIKALQNGVFADMG